MRVANDTGVGAGVVWKLETIAAIIASALDKN